jgi:hypothetical protein
MKNNLYLIIVVLSLYNTSLLAQRCGGKILFRVIDKSRNITFPLSKTDKRNYELQVNRDNIVYSNKLIDSSSESEQKENHSYYEKKTGCGFKSWTLQIELQDKIMFINVRNAGMEIDYLFDDINFREGDFTLDLDKLEHNGNDPQTKVEVEKYLQKNN